MPEKKAPRKQDAPNESTALKVADWLTSTAIAGFGPLSSADNLANEYLIDQSYPDNDSRVDSLINWETSKNFSTGFITGLGGFITIPVAVPASLGASWLIQARMAAAIAKIYGHDPSEDRVKTAILLVIIGQDLKEVCKEAGVKVTTKISYKLIEKIPGKVLTEINKKVGFKLLTKAGEKGVINLTKMVPVVGGVVSGTFDAVTCRVCGKTAKHFFQPSR